VLRVRKLQPVKHTEQFRALPQCQQQWLQTLVIGPSLACSSVLAHHHQQQQQAAAVTMPEMGGGATAAAAAAPPAAPSSAVQAAPSVAAAIATLEQHIWQPMISDWQQLGEPTSGTASEGQYNNCCRH